ncbi:ArsR/SmtB family transcription factor [Paenibacillus koleovorans]|uniref:ArsR/SmtB family transcription factor n=1 Tax=Paenibacillus koleovorans TaxID=121608 RepID=UPI000FDB3073|nr:helix-turn-helix domain-containing protein [Paenibacillus koleovorans]
MEQETNVKRIPTPALLETAKALASDLRLRILESLSEKPMSVSELTAQLGVAQPTISINVQMLEEAGLVETVQRFGRGKLLSRTCDVVMLQLPKVPNELSQLESIQMPVGMFSDFRVKATCGLVGKDGLIGAVDDPQAFYWPERADAFLVWFSEDGYIEYRFPNGMTPSNPPHAISISAEVCSEVQGYREDWPSDITLSINGVEVGTWTSPGDFGGKKGELTPSWWLGGTQYGLLTEWTVDAQGSSVNGERVEGANLAQLRLQPGEPIVVRFAVKPDAANCGGLNILGKHFGNVQQDIKLTLHR